MKPALIFAILALVFPTVAAAEPSPVTGVWSPQHMPGVGGVPLLRFTRDGRLYAVTRYAMTPRGPDVPAALGELLGQYRAQDDKIVIRSTDGTYAFELMKDGRLCRFPGPGVVPVDGAVKLQNGDRQCYKRVT